MLLVQYKQDFAISILSFEVTVYNKKKRLRGFSHTDVPELNAFVSIMDVLKELDAAQPPKKHFTRKILENRIV